MLFRSYTRGADYPPMQALLRYVGEITRIRQELFSIVSLGEKLDASAGVFKADPPVLRLAGPFATAPHARWTVFRDVKTGRRAAVLANLGSTPLRVARLQFAGNKGRGCDIHEPFQPVRSSRPPV